MVRPILRRLFTVLRRNADGKARLRDPVIERRRNPVIAPHRIVKAGRGIRKRPKPEKTGAAGGPVRNILKRSRIAAVSLDPVQMVRQILAEDAKPGQCALFPEHGAGFFVHLLILHVGHLLPARIALHRSLTVVTITPLNSILRETAMKYPKYCVPVKATLEDGSQHYGGIHVIQSQRVLDVLCDDRPFIPFKLRDRTILMNKSKVVQIDLLELSEIKEKQDMLPEVNLDYLNVNNW